MGKEVFTELSRRDARNLCWLLARSRDGCAELGHLRDAARVAHTRALATDVAGEKREIEMSRSCVGAVFNALEGAHVVDNHRCAALGVIARKLPHDCSRNARFFFDALKRPRTCFVKQNRQGGTNAARNRKSLDVECRIDVCCVVTNNLLAL